MNIAEEPLTEDLKEQVHKGFSKHALSSVGSDGNMEHITFTARNNNLLLGVVHTQTFWGALHIKYLYVASGHRKKGLGTELMKRVLKRSQDKGARFAFVETMNFQAVNFYQKLGFKEEFSRSGYDKNTSIHYLRMDF